jgi:hypothetical protein
MTLLIALAAACSDEAEVVVPNAEDTGDSMEIVFEVPTCYAYTSFTTRAESSEPLPTTPFPQDADSFKMLSVGSTVWLSYQKLQVDDAGIVKKDANGNLIPDGEEETKPYVVRGMRDSILTLYACVEKATYTTSSKDGTTSTWREPDLTKSGVPLYLKEGWYRFSVISPALPMGKTDGDDNYCTKVRNGVYFCASDIRYPNSRNQEFQVKVQTNGVQRITLQPMVWQVARLNFTITHGPKVTDLGISSAGIEVSGLQNPVNAAGDSTYFNWRSSNLADTIPMRMGDKRSWVTIRGEDCTVKTTTTNGVKNTVITGDVGVLPTNGLSTVFVFLFNLTVNGIPTQYEVTVNKQILYHGRQYPVKITVDGTDDVTVMTWSNQSWTADAVLSVKRKTDF